jgi:hypothetical protein
MPRLLLLNVTHHFMTLYKVFFVNCSAELGLSGGLFDGLFDGLFGGLFGRLSVGHLKMH